MDPGTIFFDTEFSFRDGEQAKKLFVVLGSGDGVAVVVKTTSKSHRYDRHFGCQVTGRFPCFYLPVSSTFLREDTWICLHEFYEFSYGELVQKHFSGTINRMGMLTAALTKDLLTCAISCPDITMNQEQIVRSALANI